MSNINSLIALAATELSAVMTGSPVLIGTLTNSPVVIIFDNQGTASIALFVNQTTNVWRTFPAGEAIILDMRGNHGKAEDFTFLVGTTFFGNGASGTFSISYLYAQN